MRGNYRNKKLLEVVRQSPCQHCGAEDGKGMGIKAHDYKIAALCFRCHSELDQGKTMGKDERKHLWQNAHNSTIAWLFTSGKIKL